jgi:hypothetical protein
MTYYQLSLLTIITLAIACIIAWFLIREIKRHDATKTALRSSQVERDIWKAEAERWETRFCKLAFENKGMGEEEV